MKNHAIIILAAGASTRLGTPKQLLKYEGKTLIRRIAEAAHSVAGKQVIIVTGNQHNEIEAEVANLDVSMVNNPGWEQGMGSSVAAGIASLHSNFPEVTGAILAVCDQPFVTPDTFIALIEKANAQETIVASQYADTLGTPALFPKMYFPELLALKDSEGAKKLFQQHLGEVVNVQFSLGKVDIDTPEDYENLLKS